MPFAPATQFLFDQYGQDTGVNDRKRRAPAPRYARNAPPPQPDVATYAPNSPLYGGAPPDQTVNTPPPQVMKQLQEPVPGPRSATLGDPGRLPWPRIGPDYFDEDRRY